MDLDKQRQKLEDNITIKKYFTNRKNKKNYYVSWKELIGIFGDEADSHSTLKVNKMLARCHIEMHNTAFNSIWGLKYYPQFFINMYTLVRRKNVYLSQNVLWVLGTNKLLQNMAYFQQFNLPIINLRRFYDFNLLKKEQIVERTKYLQNYIGVIKNRKYDPKLDLIKEKFKTPISVFQKQKINSKHNKQFYTHQKKRDYDEKQRTIRNKYTSNFLFTLPFFMSIYQNVKETGNFDETRSKLKNIQDNSQLSCKFFFQNFALYKSQLEKIPTQKFFDDILDSACLRNVGGETKQLNFQGMMRRKYVMFGKNQENLWPGLSANDSFYKGLEYTYIGSEQDVNTLLSVSYYQNDHTDQFLRL